MGYGFGGGNSRNDRPSVLAARWGSGEQVLVGTGGSGGNRDQVEAGANLVGRE